MDIKIDTALERDIDLLIIEEFIADKSFAQMFLDTIGIRQDYTLLKAIHSKTDPEYGESDIVFVLKIGSKLHAIHIENKINAIAMPQQNARYHLRAQKDISNGEYDSYSVIITAPKKYLSNNKEAHKYEYKVAYEQMYAFMKSQDGIRYEYKSALLERAIKEQNNGYQWTAHPDVVRFCSEMYDYQKRHFPGMPIGTTAWWPHFKTIHKDIEVQFKANKGHCDLAFTRLSYPELYKKMKDKITGDMVIVETGKSSAIRIQVKPIRFEDDFEAVADDVKEALLAIKALLDFGNTLD